MARTFGRFKYYPHPGIIIDTNKGKIANPRTLQNEAFEQSGASVTEFRKITAHLKHPMEILIEDYKYYFPELDLYESEYKCCRCGEDYFKTTKSGGKHLKNCTGSGKAKIVRGNFKVQLQWATTVASASQRRKYFVINPERKIYEEAEPGTTENAVVSSSPNRPQDNHVVQVVLPNETYNPNEIFSESELFSNWPYNNEVPFLMTTPRHADKFGFRTFITDQSYIFEQIGQNSPGSIGGVSAEYSLAAHIVTRLFERKSHLFQKFSETDFELLLGPTGTKSWNGSYFSGKSNQKSTSVLAQLLYTLCSLTHYEWVQWTRESIDRLDLIKKWIKQRASGAADWALDEDSVYAVLKLEDNPPDVILDSVQDLFVGLVQQEAGSLAHPMLAAFVQFVYDFQYNAFKTNQMVKESLENVIYGLRYFGAVSAMRLPVSDMREVFLRYYTPSNSTVFGFFINLLQDVQDDTQQAAGSFHIQRL